MVALLSESGCDDDADRLRSLVRSLEGTVAECHAVHEHLEEKRRELADLRAKRAPLTPVAKGDVEALLPHARVSFRPLPMGVVEVLVSGEGGIAEALQAERALAPLAPRVRFGGAVSGRSGGWVLNGLAVAAPPAHRPSDWEALLSPAVLTPKGACGNECQTWRGRAERAQKDLQGCRAELALLEELRPVQKEISDLTTALERLPVTWPVDVAQALASLSTADGGWQFSVNRTSVCFGPPGSKSQCRTFTSDAGAAAPGGASAE